MQLEPFTGTEIRSSVMGVPIQITEQIIASVLGVEAEGMYSGIEIPNPKTSSWKDIVNMTLFNSTKAGKYSDLDMQKKMLLKILYENLLPKGGGSCNTPFPKIRNLNKIIRVKPQTEHYTAYKNSSIENKTIKLQQPTFRNSQRIILSIIISPQVKILAQRPHQNVFNKSYIIMSQNSIHRSESIIEVPSHT